MEKAQATPFELELETLVVRGNIVPATAGETLEALFEIEPNRRRPYCRRQCQRGCPLEHLYNENFSSYAVSVRRCCFPAGSEARNVVSHGPSLDHAAPEVRVLDTATNGEWEWKRSMLGSVPLCLPTRTYTVDDGSWRRVALYRRVDETDTAQELFTSTMPAPRRNVAFR